jgi:hypothetical protein
LSEHVEGNLYAGIPQVAQKVGAINVLDIKVVVVAPANWPSLIIPERITAVLEAVISADHLGVPHVEGMVVTEVGTVTSVRNAPIMAAIVPVATVVVVAAVGSNGLSLLPSGLLHLL